MSYMIFAKSETTQRVYRCSPEMASQVEAAFWLEEIQELWPQAYVVELPGPVVHESIEDQAAACGLEN